MRLKKQDKEVFCTHPSIKRVNEYMKAVLILFCFILESHHIFEAKFYLPCLQT